MTLIRLDGHYQNIQNVHIPPGTYDINDGALRGLGEYLVKTGHATVIVAKSPAPPPAAEIAPKSLDDMTVAELKAAAEAGSINLGGAKTKADIIAAITAASPTLKAPDEDEPEA